MTDDVELSEEEFLKICENGMEAIQDYDRRVREESRKLQCAQLTPLQHMLNSLHGFVITPEEYIRQMEFRKLEQQLADIESEEDIEIGLYLTIKREKKNKK